MKHFKSFLIIAVAFFAGSVVALGTTLVLAHGGDTNFVHACVKNNTLLPNAANVRIVGENVNCNANETALDWPKTAGSGGNSDLVCISCQPKDILHRINQPDLTDVDFDDAVMTLSFFNNTDISGSSFLNAVLTQVDFLGTTGTDTDFSNANLRFAEMQESADFSRAKYINADIAFGGLNNGTFVDADFTNANLTNAFLTGATVTDANLTNVNLTDAILTGAIDMDTTTRTGVIWSNTTCPDGTNSNDNGNTCEGHLTP